MTSVRRSDFDVTNSVQVSSPRAVLRAVEVLYRPTWPGLSMEPLARAFEHFEPLFAGRVPGSHGVDTVYHDRQHTLDITLALARLLVGYERQQNESGRLGGARAVVGLITGLFHDVGYLRRTDDRDSRNGAEFTRTHVSRGARFLEEYLPVLGFGSWAPVATEIIHFTGYEQPFARIEERVSDPRDITVGHMLGTADMIAQMADRCYLEKCRDRLYAEFVVGGSPCPSATAIGGSNTPRGWTCCAKRRISWPKCAASGWMGTSVEPTATWNCYSKGEIPTSRPSTAMSSIYDKC